MRSHTGHRMRVMIVDDSRANLALFSSIVKGLDCVAVAFDDPRAALANALTNPADMIIADYIMPGMDGLELIEELRLLNGYADVPMVMVSACDDTSILYKALDMGVTDFLRKPIDAVEVKARLRNLLKLREAQGRLQHRVAWLDQEVRRATRKLAAREEEIIIRLSRAAESRDCDTGVHIVRVASYCRLIGEALDLGEAQCQTLALAAPMHDIGKIAVSDAILLKPGKLTQEERAMMEMHTLYGFQILSGSDSELIRSAADIAASHHERWDGTGYPARSKEQDIPLFGRIAAVADVFDALTSARPYKKAWTPEDAFAYLKACSGQQFDPQCVNAFTLRWQEAMKIYREKNEGLANKLPAGGGCGAPMPQDAGAEAEVSHHLPA
ncbi:MAG: response regulator [Hyphomicrobiaceae bacterium]|nr:response regulator [Hyphomicrobiaceae bacterium]